MKNTNKTKFNKNFLGLKRPMREADHSPPPQVPRSRMGGAIPPSTPPIRSYGVVLCYKKHRDNFNFMFYYK
jgi:hypothetical protein